MTRTAAKFTKIAALITRGATDGERAAARNAGRKLIARHGIAAAMPGHPMSDASDARGIIDALRACWDFNEHRNTSNDRVEFWAAFAALQNIDVIEVGMAYHVVREARRRMFEGGKFVGNSADTKFFNVIEWGIEQEYNAGIAKPIA